MAGRKGAFIVIYGPGGVGKTKQLQLLEEKLRSLGVPTRSVKYPVYEMQPTGPKLDRIIHKRVEDMPEEPLQELFAQNRRDFEPTLKSWLEAGVWVVAENYKGSGMVWGNLHGVSQEKMDSLTADQVEPDLALFIDGPLRADLETGGPFYQNEEEWYRVRKVYLQMADKYGWVRVGADAPVLTVANRIWAIVRPILESRGR